MNAVTITFVLFQRGRVFTCRMEGLKEATLEVPPDIPFELLSPFLSWLFEEPSLESLQLRIPLKRHNVQGVCDEKGNEVEKAPFQGLLRKTLQRFRGR